MAPWHPSELNSPAATAVATPDNSRVSSIRSTLTSRALPPHQKPPTHARLGRKTHTQIGTKRRRKSCLLMEGSELRHSASPVELSQ